MLLLKSLLFNLFLYLGIIAVFLIALPTLLLPPQFTLYFGKFLGHYVVFIVRIFLGTKVEFIDNKCTGKYLPPSALGEGKLKLVTEWAKIEGFNLEIATFYSDSINDLPLLEKVNNPIAVNPDPKLEKISITRGWKILDLPRI